MITAIQANEKAKAYEVKVIEDNRERAIKWVEEKVAPDITAEAEKGHHVITVRVPNNIEWVYARDYLKQNGFSTEGCSYGDYRIRW